MDTPFTARALAAALLAVAALASTSSSGWLQPLADLARHLAW